MFITTNTSSRFPLIVTSQLQKTEETQNFVSLVSETEETRISTIQRVQEFPKGLLQDIEKLSNLMLDIDTYAKEGEARGAVYSNNRGNASYVLGGYEYVLSKADKTATLSDLIPDGVFYSSATNYTPLQESNDEKRYRPFATNFHSRESSFIPTETFPEELNRQSDMGYTYADFESNLRTIEKLVDKQLLVEYEKDPRSDETQQLLFLKAKITTMPEVFEKDRQLVHDNIQLILDGDGDNALPIETTIDFHQNLWIRETAMLAEFGLNLNKFLSDDEQQQVIDSLNVILNYSDHHWFEGFGAEISSLFKQDNIMASQLKESSKEFQESLISRFSAIDNTEILLNLASDSSLQTNTKESKTYESLIDRIRSKLKGNDDSILQQVMSKITNGVKASGIAEGA